MVFHRLVVMSAVVALVILSRPDAGRCQSYLDCRQCHSDIFELWKGSLHAKSYENPTIRATFMTMKFKYGEKVSRECLKCHAPNAYRSGDFEPDSPTLIEGVSCSFCHLIESVNQGTIDTYYNLDTSGTIYGPYDAGGDAEHEIKHSQLFLKSELCAGCHNYVNDLGVGILETFDEWAASPYPPQEVYCQNCHMPIMPELKIADNLDVADYYVTAHEFKGGHSHINLEYAANLETSVRKNNRRLDIEVRITNAESGHKLPTGIPSRKLVLEVLMRSAYDSTVVSVVRKVYRKALTDKYGAIIENVPDMFLTATDIFSDNRIEPKETRVEDFVFEVPKWLSNYYIETTLNYEYSRPILTEENISVEMDRNIIDSKSIR
jgi:hypothetical protein